MSRPNEPLPYAEASQVVGPADVASAFAIEPTDAFPEVYATARLVFLMETAAARCLVPLLEPGQLSVGVSVTIRHTAPTALRGRVTARAEWLGLESKLHRFKVSASDEAGEVGSGEHTRAIVDTERLVAAATKRKR